MRTTARFPSVFWCNGVAGPVILAVLLCRCSSPQPSPGSLQDVVPETVFEGCDDPQATTEGGWWDSAIFYEIFVRSFMDSDGDGIGDLQGILQRLDYLNDGRPGEGDDLEVDAIWLMPIFESPSYHGYDTIDYLHVERDYGTNDDLGALIEACRERSVRVIFDLVVNHTSNQHPWFLDSRSSPDSERRSYYLWRPDDPGWTQPWSSNPVWHLWEGQYYYGLFWAGMPDLNYADPRVAAEMTDVARTWLERGAAGFRIDAARHLFENDQGNEPDLPETHTFFQQFTSELQADHPEIYLVAETWAPRDAVATYYGEGREFQQAFAFDFAEAIETALTSSSVAPIREALGSQVAHATPWSFEATFLSNHDIDRLAQRLPQQWMQRAAASLLMTLPGTPYIYYGDELGMGQGTGGGDEAKRTPMPWDGSTQAGFTSGQPWYSLSSGHESRNVSVELADTDSLLNHYRTLIRLRKGHASLRTGGCIRLVETDHDQLLAMFRYDDRERLLVLVNLGEEVLDPQPLDLSAHADLVGPAGGPVSCLLGSCGTFQGSAGLDAFPVGGSLQVGEARVIQFGE
ncbi:MAG: DUF3459 domain-containing protein [Bradymonadales bacterium]|nr:DUF3459 domain-containing protein [Bradymonadales bacterium]